MSDEESESKSMSSYRVPTKGIVTQEQLQVFQNSDTYNIIVTYVERLNESVIGVKSTEPCEESQVSKLDIIFYDVHFSEHLLGDS